MNLAPGRLPWLLLWDLRIRSRMLAIGRLQPLAVILYVVFALVAHALAGLTVWTFAYGPKPMTAAELQHFAGSMLAFLTFFMAMAALLGALRMAFAGRELSLHLSAPVLPAHVLWMRGGSLVASTWAVAILFAVPVANMGALLGVPRLLLIYPVTIAMATCTVAVSLLLVALTLSTLGVTRARRVLQWAQVMVPLGFVLLNLGQGRASGVPGTPPVSFGGFDRYADDLRLPARALTGETDALAALIAVAALAMWLAVTLVRAPLLAAWQTPDAAPRPAVAGRGVARAGSRFGRPLWQLLVLKEWRTILRDPRFAAALLVQPMIVLPFFYLRFMQGSYQLAGAAAAATFVAAQMSQFTANLMISAEEAPTLLGAAPVSRTRLIVCKCLAALLPVWTLMLVPAAWLVTRDAWIGTVCFVCTFGGAFCACAVEVARPYPSPRRSWVQMQAARRKRDPLDIASIAMMQIGWSGGAWFLADRNAWGAAIVFGVILVPFIQWWRDANRLALLGY